MSRPHPALVVGILLLIAACVLPGIRFADLAGTSLPHQDAPPHLVEQHAADVAAAEHRLLVAVAVAAVLAVLGVTAVAHGWRQRRPAERGRR
ncbi:hypothetical protein K7640_29150 [Micromonospora sp. PLK6-60]|uniref:hypothetical protein n=1 Tax=Micromonospora sp. PLK6-60 TaxID=2873383 RepID=UPI001CA601FD|nr:hypothetical protein [Micromonospora sp. PLK6-60]MBY8875903.1 hypothetical protein [Micromonospora sp. PLK6-60]